MVLGDLNRTRRLAGNPATTNVSDADITQGLIYGLSHVIRITGKTDWETDTLNPLYPAAQECDEYFGSSYIRDRFQDQSDISTEHWNRANAIATQLADSLASLSSSGGGGTGISMRLYRSNPLNRGAPTYRSMTSTGQLLVGIGEYDIPSA